MREDLLHYVWRLQKFNTHELSTTSGDTLTIIQKGNYNHNAGPDFLEARIEIDDTLWAGHIEIHKNSSEWYLHGHDQDLAYDNVILHVVYRHDREVMRKDGTVIPTLVLEPRMDLPLIGKYEELIHNETWIPCQPDIFQVAEFVKNNWKDRLIIDRLQEKTSGILEDLVKTQMDWESVFFTYLAMHLGTKVNKDAFRTLGMSLSRQILLKNRGNLKNLEAILFGQAGMLDQSFQDDYPNELQYRYNHIRQKYDLQPINRSVWNFLRLRPANFPTIRIAQLAQMINQTEHLFSKCMAALNIKEYLNTFDIQISNYWKDHYVFDKASKQSKNKKLGKSTIFNLLINTICPFLFLYGREKGITAYQDKAIELLEQIPPEKNRIVTQWNQLNYQAEHAMDTQALIQLKNRYCDEKRCLQCHIGHALMK